MKKSFIIVSILLLAFACLFCYICDKENDTIVRLGVNTEIVEINKDDKMIGVCYKGEDESIDLKFNVDCRTAIEKHQIFYCDYSTQRMQELSFDSLLVGDEVLLSLNNTDFLQLHNDDTVRATQIQLAPQRLSVEEGSA